MFQGLKQSGFQVGVWMMLRLRLGLGLRMMLRRAERPFPFTCSHRSLLIRQCWLGRVRCFNTGRCPFRFLFSFVWRRHSCLRLLLCFDGLLLVPRLPAVGNLGQELADMLDFGLGPRMNA